MRRSTPLLIMGFLWILLISGLGLGFLMNRRELDRRQRLGERLVLRYGDGAALAHGRGRAEAAAECERAARGNPSNPAVWSVWALLEAQGVLQHGDDPAEWSRIHRVASTLLGRDWAGTDARTRIRLLASRVLVRAATAETRADLIENFHEALRSWDFWPKSALLRNAALWAGISAGQSAFVRDRLPGPELALDWPLLLDWSLSHDQFGAAEDLLDRWRSTDPENPLLPLWRSWIACRRGGKVSLPAPGAVTEPPVPRAWRQLVRACASAGEPGRGIAELEKVPEPVAEEANIDDLRRQMKDMQDRLERMSKEPKKDE